MSLTEREKEIAQELGIPADKAEAFLSSIRDEQEADAWIVEYDNAPPSLFNQHPTAHIFGAVSPLFKIPPSPECDCNELLEALEKIVEACCMNKFTPTGSFLNAADALIAKHKAMKGER